MNGKLIALDAGGVLLDYGAAYPHAWRRAFGVFPREIDPSSNWPLERWDVERLSGERLDDLRRHFDKEFWSSMAAIEGAVDATLTLRDAGYELVCVSALEPAFEQARLRNLHDLGFPIERVIATSSRQREKSESGRIDRTQAGRLRRRLSPVFAQASSRNPRRFASRSRRRISESQARLGVGSVETPRCRSVHGLVA